MIPFGDWLPDQPDFQNPGLLVAEGVYPSAGGYSPFFSAVGQGGTTTEMVNGAQMYIDNSSNPQVFGGSSTRLFALRSGTVTETSGYAAATRWNFERFDNFIIAVSIENDPQYLTDIVSDNVWSTLPGTPPKAAQVGKVDDFLVFGDLIDNADGGGATAPNRLRWGAKNNPAGAWITDRGELSGFRDLDPRYGRITAIVGGRYGLIFQERAIWRMVFVGAPKVFEFEQVSVDMGCVASGSAVTIGTDTFFLSQNGFSVTNGAGAEPIGNYRVNDWFAESVDETNINKVHGSVNWPARSIVWTFQTPGAQRFNRQVIHNFVLDKWSSAVEVVDFLVKFKISGETLGSLAGTFPTLGDASAFTLGSQEFKARDLVFGSFIQNGAGSEFALFTGDSVAAAFQTGDTMIAPGYRSEVTGIWPVVETVSNLVTTRVRSREQHGGADRFTSPTTRGADGYCPQKIDGWLHAAEMTIPAGVSWNNAQGVIPRAKRTGRR